MRYKLAVFDIDGTLVGPRRDGDAATGQGVPASAAEALQGLAAAGVAVAVGTARPYHSAMRPFEEIGVIGEAITSSGADVRRADGGVVRQEALPDVDARFLADLCDRAGWTSTVATTAGMLIRFDAVPEWLDRAPPTTRGVTSLAAELPFEMLSVVTGTGDDDAAVAKIEAHPGLYLQRAFNRDGGLLVTVTKAGVDKGTGLLALCESLGVAPDEVVAFGDSEVDLPMFRASGMSVAMGNAPADIQGQAGMVTDDVLEDGVANAIRRIWG